MSEISRKIRPGMTDTDQAGGANPAWECPMLLRCALLAVLVPLSLRPAAMAAAAVSTPQSDLALVNRLSWGEPAGGDTWGGLPAQAWLERQLHPSADDGLPPEAQA